MVIVAGIDIRVEVGIYNLCTRYSRTPSTTVPLNSRQGSVQVTAVNADGQNFLGTVVGLVMLRRRGAPGGRY